MISFTKIGLKKPAIFCLFVTKLLIVFTLLVGESYAVLGLSKCDKCKKEEACKTTEEATLCFGQCEKLISEAEGKKDKYHCKHNAVKNVCYKNYEPIEAGNDREKFCEGMGIDNSRLLAHLMAESQAFFYDPAKDQESLTLQKTLALLEAGAGFSESTVELLSEKICYKGSPLDLDTNRGKICKNIEVDNNLILWKFVRSFDAKAHHNVGDSAKKECAHYRKQIKAFLEAGADPLVNYNPSVIWVLSGRKDFVTLKMVLEHDSIIRKIPHEDRVTLSKVVEGSLSDKMWKGDAEALLKVIKAAAHT